MCSNKKGITRNLMNGKSPLNFDISVSADKKRRAKNRGKSGAFAPSGKKCHHKGCELEGTFRAPKSPDLIDEFHWFCLKHVKEYNQKWNFFAPLSFSNFHHHLKILFQNDSSFVLILNLALYLIQDHHIMLRTYVLGNIAQ